MYSPVNKKSACKRLPSGHPHKVSAFVTCRGAGGIARAAHPTVTMNAANRSHPRLILGDDTFAQLWRALLGGR
jgi:hypothetical protein